MPTRASARGVCGASWGSAYGAFIAGGWRVACETDSSNRTR